MAKQIQRALWSLIEPEDKNILWLKSNNDVWTLKLYNNGDWIPIADEKARGDISYINNEINKIYNIIDPLSTFDYRHYEAYNPVSTNTARAIVEVYANNPGTYRFLVILNTRELEGYKDITSGIIQLTVYPTEGGDAKIELTSTNVPFFGYKKDVEIIRLCTFAEFHTTITLVSYLPATQIYVEKSFLYIDLQVINDDVVGAELLNGVTINYEEVYNKFIENKDFTEYITNIILDTDYNNLSNLPDSTLVFSYTNSYGATTTRTWNPFKYKGDFHIDLGKIEGDYVNRYYGLYYNVNIENYNKSDNCIISTGNSLITNGFPTNASGLFIAQSGRILDEVKFVYDLRLFFDEEEKLIYSQHRQTRETRVTTDAFTEWKPWIPKYEAGDNISITEENGVYKINAESAEPKLPYLNIKLVIKEIKNARNSFMYYVETFGKSQKDIISSGDYLRNNGNGTFTLYLDEFIEKCLNLNYISNTNLLNKVHVTFELWNRSMTNTLQINSIKSNIVENIILENKKYEDEDYTIVYDSLILISSSSNYSFLYTEPVTLIVTPFEHLKNEINLYKDLKSGNSNNIVWKTDEEFLFALSLK